MGDGETSVVIADDHPVFLEGLRMVLERLTFVSIVGQASDGESAWKTVQELQPEVAILDYQMPGLDGIRIAQRIRREKLPTRVVLLTMHRDSNVVREAIDAGALGFLVKEQAAVDIGKCLKTICQGQHFIASEVSASLLTRRQEEESELTAPVEQLTKTQREVVRLIAHGLQTKEIAAEMGVSYRTIENHRHRIADRLGLTGNNSLLRFALEHRDDLR